jgi:1,4-alpha-glucan branching enzyme
VSSGPGMLAVVLHTHMPYVEGYGTWPFGEEWLWEAMATSYLPLLDVLEEAPELTLSITPVLCDQLAAPGVGERFLAFLRDVRAETHRRDIAEADDPDVVAALERSARLYEQAAERFEALGGDLLGALAPHAAWTSSATHAVLPLLATDAGVRLQVRTGVEAHRERVTGRPWRGGFWLPECAHAPWLDPLLEAEGVRATCVDLTDVLGRGDERHLRPIRSTAGPLLVPIDRAIVELVWHERGYPAAAAYRDTHAKTTYEHRPWSNAGRPYDPAQATEQARRDACDFADRVVERTAAGGLCVCALDTELLGHWWHEGVQWLGLVVAACRDRGVEIVHLDDALERVEPVAEPAGGLPVTTWGRERDLSTWSGPQVADLAFAARAAELRAVTGAGVPSDAAVRELLALQSSDWAFVVAEQVAEPYGRDRGPAPAPAPNAGAAPLLAP